MATSDTKTSVPPPLPASETWAKKFGRAVRYAVAGKWREAVTLLELHVWMGRYVGFLLGAWLLLTTNGLISGVSLSATEVMTLAVVFVVVSLVALPLTIWTTYQLLGWIGFRLRARTALWGGAEGVGFAFMFVVISFLHGLLNNAQSPLASPSTHPSRRYPGSLGPIPKQVRPEHSLASLFDERSVVGDPGQPLSDAQAAYHRGVTLFQAQDFESALEEFSTAIELDPALWPAQRMRGMTHIERGDFERAIADLTKAIELSPQTRALFTDRALAWLLLGDYLKSIEDAHRSGMQDAEACRVRGMAQFALGRHQQAIDSFTQSLRLNPTDAEVFLRRALALFELGYPMDALADCNRAVELAPEAPGAFYYRSLVRLTSEDVSVRDYEAAIQDASEACELSGWRDEAPISLLARCYAATGDESTALRFRQLADAAPSLEQ